jgi:hypothetical protein
MNEERKEKAAALYCFLPPSSLSSPRKEFFPQYFSLIKKRPSHQKKNPDRMSMFDPGVVAAAGPKRKKKI